MDRRPSASTVLNLALAAAAATALLVLALRGEPSPGVEIEVRDAPGTVDEIRVHVAGAVLRPGVVAVQPGGRVSDAIERAGGPTTDGDPDALNLARRVRDGERIEVPVRGLAERPLDLNRASAAALEALPGIGSARASAILEARERAPFHSSDELVERGIVPASVYEDIRDLVATPATP